MNGNTPNLPTVALSEGSIEEENDRIAVQVMNEEIQNRINQIRRGEVPEGYKQTKDGIYPSEWQGKKIGRWISLKERPISLQDNETYQLVTVRRGFAGVDSRGVYRGKDVLVKTYFEVRQGDFLISKRQIAHGACGVVPARLDRAVVSNEYNVFVPLDETNIDMFSLMMHLPHYKRLFYLVSDGVHIEKLLFKTNDWMKRSLAMPPITEQQKIAEILTGQDRVILLKEKRIAEKQRQKKYLVQQLLTGKIHISGFAGEWVNPKASEVFRSITNKKHNGDLEVLSATQEKGVVPRSEVDIDIKYDSASLTGYKKVEKGNFVISLRSFQGGIEYSNYEGLVSPAYTVLTPCVPIADEFYKQFFKSGDYIRRLSVAIYGIRDGKQIGYDDFGRIRIPYPPLEEQRAIAKVFNTIDHEIELLQKELEAEKKKKKALMQLLLTGIVRVKV